MIDQDIKQQWLDALRSGKYKKGKSHLRTVEKNGEHTWCCLGVLCDIVDPNAWEDHEAADLHIMLHDADGAAYLSEVVRAMIFPNRHNVISGFEQELGALNDRSETFDDAIEYIEDFA